MISWADTHKDETAVIMGNGLSLKDVPKELLGKYVTFAANFISLLPFQPTYFACVDSKILLEYPERIYEVAQSAEIAFLSDAHLDDGELYKLENVHLCNKDTVKFPGEKWWTGGTVVYAALKIAYNMGFDTILLVGCDRDKEWIYFSDEYPGAPPPPDYRRKQEYHLGLAGVVYKNAGKRIVNLSPPSVLDEYFERGRIEDWL